MKKKPQIDPWNMAAFVSYGLIAVVVVLSMEKTALLIGTGLMLAGLWMLLSAADNGDVGGGCVGLIFWLLGAVVLLLGSLRGQWWIFLMALIAILIQLVLFFVAVGDSRN